MEATHVRLLVVVVLVLLVSVATADRGVMAPAGEPANVILVGEPAPAVDAQAAAEVARIQEHLLRVEKELLSANVTHLTVAQRQNRALHIEVLREYRQRGIFPHNHRLLGRRVPVFIDEHGTHCAVGYMIARSGHEALARRIADTRNLATVPELADMPELVAWLADAGLSVDEAARIQPTYDGRRPESLYPEVTLINVTLGIGVSVWNAAADRDGALWWVPAAAGIATGLSGITLAYAGSQLSEDYRDVRSSGVALNAAAGLISWAMAGRRLALGRAPGIPASDAKAQPPTRLELAGWSPPEGGTGIRLGLRF